MTLIGKSAFLPPDLGEKKALHLEKRAQQQRAQNGDVEGLSQAEQVAKDFENLFVDLVYKSMRATAKPDDASNAQEIYQGLLDAEHSKAMTEGQNFGIRDLVLGWMKESGAIRPSDLTNSAAGAAPEGVRKNEALSAYQGQASRVIPQKD